MMASFAWIHRAAHAHALAVVWLCLLPGCLAVRAIDQKACSYRFDFAAGDGLPESPQADARVRAAGDPLGYPTLYHGHVETKDFEAVASTGSALVGFCFSGGGNRAAVFGAACVRELLDLGPIVVETRGREDATMDLFEELDYVVGVSGGSFPASLLCLAYAPGERGRPRKATIAQEDLPDWPDRFNRGLVCSAILRALRSPHYLFRDVLFDSNTRPLMVRTIQTEYFDLPPTVGNTPEWLGDGLTFGNLPPSPTLILPATIIQEPGALFVQTRLPYRYALDAEPRWRSTFGAQSFESFHIDPMTFPLAEAVYNSASFPGLLRCGLVRVHADRPWSAELSKPPAPRTESRAQVARRQPHLQGTYEVKDGGLIDNRGTIVLAELLAATRRSRARRGGDPLPEREALFLSFDANPTEVGLPEEGHALLHSGWFAEFIAQTLAMHTRSQAIIEAAVRRAGRDVGYVDVGVAYGALVDLHPDARTFPAPFQRSADETARLDLVRAALRGLAQASPPRAPQLDIATTVTIMQSITTNLTAFEDDEMRAIRTAARHAVARAMHPILAWALGDKRGQRAHFQRAPSVHATAETADLLARLREVSDLGAAGALSTSLEPADLPPGLDYLQPVREAMDRPPP